MTKSIIKYKSGAELKDISRQKLTGNYVNAILFILLRGTLGMLTTQNLWMMIFGMIVMGLMDLGMTFYFLNVACGQQTSVSDLFYGFSRDVGKYSAIVIISVGIRIICMSPYYIALYFSPDELSVRSTTIVLFMLALSMIIYIPIALLTSQKFFLILDFPEYSALDVYRHSIQIMKKHIGRLFYLMVSFIPILLLGVLSFGLGLLWIIPYIDMTCACFYMDIMNPAREVVELPDEA